MFGGTQSLAITSSYEKSSENSVGKGTFQAKTSDLQYEISIDASNVTTTDTDWGEEPAIINLTNGGDTLEKSFVFRNLTLPSEIQFAKLMDLLPTEITGPIVPFNDDLVSLANIQFLEIVASDSISPEDKRKALLGSFSGSLCRASYWGLGGAIAALCCGGTIGLGCVLCAAAAGAAASLGSDSCPA